MGTDGAHSSQRSLQPKVVTGLPIRATSGPNDASLLAAARRRLMPQSGALAGKSRVVRDDPVGATAGPRAEAVRRADAIAEKAQSASAADKKAALDLPESGQRKAPPEPAGTGAVMRRLQNERSVRGAAELRMRQSRMMQARERVRDAEEAREEARVSMERLREDASKGIVGRMAL